MRRAGKWMSVWDDRILEYLKESENESASVGDLADSKLIRVSNSHISERCAILAENGLLLALGNGVYSITEEGKAYLKGEYDAEEETYTKSKEGVDMRDSTSEVNGT